LESLSNIIHLNLREYTEDEKEAALKEYWTRVCHLYAEDPCLCPNTCYKLCRSNTLTWQKLRNVLDSGLLLFRPQVKERKSLLLKELNELRDTMTDIGLQFSNLRELISRKIVDDDAACNAPDCVSDPQDFCTTCCECAVAPGTPRWCEACRVSAAARTSRPIPLR